MISRSIYKSFNIMMVLYVLLNADVVNNPNFNLDFKYTSSWYNGFVGVITATNSGSEEIKDWVISFKGKFGINEEWNAYQYKCDTINGGYRYHFKPAHWNSVIKPGKSISFGFTASFVGELPLPHNLKLNQIDTEMGDVQSFFADWSNYMGINPKDLPLDNIDRLIHAFAIISEEGEVTHGDKYSDIEMLLPGDTPAQAIKGSFNQYNGIKNDYPDMKILYSIIAKGHNRIDFKKAAATALSRRKFTLSAIDFMKKFNFDGINIDWEFPEADDTDNLTALIKLLREELDYIGFEDNKHYELSFASPCGLIFLKDINFSAISEYLDEISIMGFNYFGPWEKHAGHNSPLYHNVTDDLPFPPEVKEYLKMINIDWTVNYHLVNGVPSHKITIGMPIYSHSWTGVVDTYGNGGLFSEGIGVSEPIFYNQVLSLYHDSGYTRYWDDLSKTAYLYHPSKNGGHFVTFDDTSSIRYKCEYVNDNHLKGAAFWMGALDGKGDESLIRKAYKTVNKPTKPIGRK